MEKKGFTLIELLIVVAIIAILAAIAVPNFLEAQVRSKVSRVKSDMRSVATALEAYSVDTNRMPPMLGAAPYGQPMNQKNYYGTDRGYGFKCLPHNLTTPIAYITSVMQDPFKQGVKARETGFLGQSYINGNPFDGTFIYHNIKQFADVSGSGFDGSDIARYGQWRIFSLGPNKTYERLGTLSPGLGWIYDPTNGTVSKGMILRTQADPEGKRFFM